MKKKSEETKKAQASIELLRVELHTFLNENPGTKIEERDGEIIIANPWCDETVPLKIDIKSDSLIKALNSVVLPPRLRAIYHKDSRDLEIIYTPFPIDSDIAKRSFEFRFGRKRYRCEFAKSSDILLQIATAFIPAAPPSNTDYRNLQEFRYYVRYTGKKRTATGAFFAQPICFWIRKAPQDENELVTLCRQINFYLGHFDRESPHIAIHEPVQLDEKRIARLRYPIGSFPSIISAKELDPYLLGLWESASNAADPFRRYIYLYQILEYAAFYYLQENILTQIKRVLLAPEMPECIDKSAHMILDSLIEDRMSDEAKIIALIDRVSDPQEIWNEIEPHIKLFSTETQFDGGFHLAPLVKAEWKKEDFIAAWMPKLPDSLRKIRNALVHSREARMVNVIAPTRMNYITLRPWIEPLRLIAYHTMLYREI